MQAHAAADQVEAEGSEIPIMEGTNGARPVSGLQSHSLSGDAYSEDEYEEASSDVRLLMPSSHYSHTHVWSTASCSTVWCLL